jgi:hypothetical protein
MRTHTLKRNRVPGQAGFQRFVLDDLMDALEDPVNRDRLRVILPLIQERLNAPTKAKRRSIGRHPRS